MSKRLIHPKGPKELKANTTKIIVVDDKPRLEKVLGFPGYNGWRNNDVYKNANCFCPTNTNGANRISYIICFNK